MARRLAEARVIAFDTRALPSAPSDIAPDGSGVRKLLALECGSMAQFELAAGRTSGAVVHRSVDEIWYVVSGHGQMWRSQGGREEIVELSAGVCLTIPVGTCFQFRACANAPLAVVGVTMPPWPGEQEAMIVTGPWTPSTFDKDPM
jgi:mannose-6-phosphate isomerase-like protein (cupin superfamily)